MLRGLESKFKNYNSNVQDLLEQSKAKGNLKSYIEGKSFEKKINLATLLNRKKK